MTKGRCFLLLSAVRPYIREVLTSSSIPCSAVKHLHIGETWFQVPPQYLRMTSDDLLRVLVWTIDWTVVNTTLRDNIQCTQNRLSRSWLGVSEATSGCDWDYSRCRNCAHPPPQHGLGPRMKRHLPRVILIESSLRTLASRMHPYLGDTSQLFALIMSLLAWTAHACCSLDGSPSGDIGISVAGSSIMKGPSGAKSIISPLYHRHATQREEWILPGQSDSCSVLWSNYHRRFQICNTEVTMKLAMDSGQIGTRIEIKVRSACSRLHGKLLVCG